MTSRYEGRELLRRDLRQPAVYFANPSFNRTCHGRRSWPSTGHVVHFPVLGQAHLPRPAG
jgi:hypothetical protein